MQGYLRLAAQGRYRDALALIKKDNPFPAVCGRICNHVCEAECTRGSIDEAVAIDEVKRFIADQDLNAETRYIPPMVNQTGEPYPEKIAIIGAGPAGMSCAFYLAQKGYRPVVFDKAGRPGGMLMNGIPSFRLEKDVVEAEIDILKEMGSSSAAGSRSAETSPSLSCASRATGAFTSPSGRRAAGPSGCRARRPRGRLGHPVPHRAQPG